MLGGTASPAWLRDGLRRLAKTIPGATLVELPGRGHNAPNADAPKEVATHLRQFFASDGAQPSAPPNKGPYPTS